MRGLFDGTESTSTSDAGSTYDDSISSPDLVAQDASGFTGSSFKFPAKGRVSKPKIFEPMTQTKLANRFGYFEENIPENDNDILRANGRKSPLSCSPPKMETESKQSEIPMTSSMKSEIEHKSMPENKLLNTPTSFGPNPSVLSNDGVKGKTETYLPMDSTQEENNLRRQGKVKCFDPSGLRYGFIVMEGCSKDVFFHVNDVHGEEELALKGGDEVTFIYNEYRKRGTEVQVWISFLKHRIKRLDYELEQQKNLREKFEIEELKTPP